MRYYRSLPLAALLAGLALPAVALPAVAQPAVAQPAVAQPATAPEPGIAQAETTASAPKSGTDAALPDAGIRKSAPEKLHHHRVRRSHPVAF